MPGAFWDAALPPVPVRESVRAASEPSGGRWARPSVGLLREASMARTAGRACRRSVSGHVSSEHRTVPGTRGHSSPCWPRAKSPGARSASACSHRLVGARLHRRFPSPFPSSEPYGIWRECLVARLLAMGFISAFGCARTLFSLSFRFQRLFPCRMSCERAPRRPGGPEPATTPARCPPKRDRRAPSPQAPFAPP